VPVQTMVEAYGFRKGVPVQTMIEATGPGTACLSRR